MTGTGQASGSGQGRVTLSGLSCVRGGRMLFTGVSLALGPGGAALVSGPNGTGKSSLLRMLAGLLTPYGGHIETAGGISLSDDLLALDSDRALGDALGFWVRIDGAGTRAADAMDALDLAHLAAVPVRMLSTGQRKRASLARTAASGAAIWLLDEPANGLDAASMTRLAAIVERHRAAGGVVIAASHMALPWREDATVVLRAPDADELEDPPL